MRLLLYPAFIACLAAGNIAVAQEHDGDYDRSIEDSLEASLQYAHGEVVIGSGLARLVIPDGFKFLDDAQSRFVLVDLWGNPGADDVLGMVMPDTSGVLSSGNFAFVIQYDDIGHVKDDDAGKIDYEALLKEMQADNVESNKMREAAGYQAMWLVGWADPPRYDKDLKVLYWAKEFMTDDGDANTLNYNVRVLGRRGVLVLNAVSSMDELALVKDNVPLMLEMVRFADGHRYADFDPGMDEVAAWTIGGLVAGKVLSKAGILALFMKNIKLLLVALVAIGAVVWHSLTGRKPQDPPAAS